MNAYPTYLFYANGVIALMMAYLMKSNSNLNKSFKAMYSIVAFLTVVVIASTTSILSVTVAFMAVYYLLSVGVFCGMYVLWETPIYGLFHISLRNSLLLLTLLNTIALAMLFQLIQVHIA